MISKQTVISSVTMVLLATAGEASAQFGIDWYTVDGGGAMFTTSGNFELSGTLGQPDSASMSGGGWSLVGGFWGAVAGAPPSTVTIFSANPPTDNPYLAGQQPFRDVLDTGGGPILTEGIGSEETSPECSLTYAPIQVTFSAAPSVAPSEPGGTTISCSGGTPYPCPCIVSVTGSGAGPYAIYLDDCAGGTGVLPPGQCMTITFAGAQAPGGGPPGSLSYQSLPGDVNMSGAVSSTDVLALVTAINNGQAALCENLPRYDINRSGTVSAADVLREVQLLNGLNSPQAFLGATVAACP